MKLPEPTVDRPAISRSYGISSEADGLLEWSWAAERLATSRNYWVATAHSDGRPHSMPVWGVWLEDGFHFGTSRSSRKARNLARDPRVVIHLESGDEVVILEGAVEDSAVDEVIAEAFAAKYDWRPEVAEDEGTAWYRLRPAFVLAWLERDYPGTATRFSFGERMSAASSAP